MHLRDLKLPPGTSAKLSVRAIDGAGNLGSAAIASITVSKRLAAPLPQRSPDAERRRQAATLPRVAGCEVAILDELDKVHPVTGEMIPSQPEGYLAANHLWDAARAHHHTPRGAERVRRLPGPAAR